MVNPNQQESTPIPQPRETLFLGNLLDLTSGGSIASLWKLAKTHGDIYRLSLNGTDLIAVSSQELVHYLSNADKFQKSVNTDLLQVRDFAGDGLFTAFAGEPNWTLAHRILMPAFGPLAIKKMQGMMTEILSEMLLFWEHHAGQPFDVSDMYTRLTFDTIGWCAFRYRFNSFHSEKLHPYIETMVRLLKGAEAKALMPAIVHRFWAGSEFAADIAELHRMTDEVIAERRRNPNPEAGDLLNNMILDSADGKHLSDENIRYQVVTFLIAGHETTSGLLSFATYYLLKNPEKLRKVREEADKAMAEVEDDISKLNPHSLKYIDAVLKETLRLQPSAPGWSVEPKSEDGETLPGGYYVPKTTSVFVLLHPLHRQKNVWGDDAEEFVPERWLDGRSDNIPQDSWKPFGNGQRACIGRGFAMQEAQLALALITNRFNIEMADPDYDLEIKESLTIKPGGFRIIANPRNKNKTLLSELIGGVAHPAPSKDSTGATGASGSGKLYVYYGSNSGSCSGLAQEVASEGTARGFDVVTGSLDSQVPSAELPTDGRVVIITASYEGRPTDDAKSFVENLAKDKDLSGLKYTVMAVGHSDWNATFLKIPKSIDARCAELGGERFLPMHTADAASDMVSDFENFKTDLWELLAPGASVSAVKTASGESDAQPVRIVAASANPAGESVNAGIDGVGKVVAQEVLLDETATSQINCTTIELPEDQTYKSGYYLAVLAKNPKPSIERVLAYFDIKAEDNVILNIPGSFLPTAPVRIGDLLASYVELGQPMSKNVLTALRELCTEAPKDAKAIGDLIDNYAEKVTAKRLSLLDMTSTLHTRVPLDFFLSHLPKMKIRQYSISSSPLDNPRQVTLTYTVHKSADGAPLGVASNYLAFLSPGDDVLCCVKKSDFVPPADPKVPLILFAAGSGIAPLRGFIHERALQKKAGEEVGDLTLFFGTQTPADIPHEAELNAWVESGILDFRPVFSKSTGDDKYVQHRVWRDREKIKSLFDAGAQLYTCGAGRLATGLRETLLAIIQETIDSNAVAGTEWEGKSAQDIYEACANNRYRTDVFL